MKEMVKVFKAICDENRLKILLLLSTRNICAKGIARHLEISEAAVSQHIRVLKEAQLIVAYKKGYYVMYELNKEVLEDAIGFIKLLINRDFSLINNEYNVNLNDFDINVCKGNCKTIHGCCKKILKEE